MALSKKMKIGLMIGGGVALITTILVVFRKSIFGGGADAPSENVGSGGSTGGDSAGGGSFWNKAIDTVTNNLPSGGGQSGGTPPVDTSVIAGALVAINASMVRLTAPQREQTANMLIPGYEAKYKVKLKFVASPQDGKTFVQIA